jgi:hypothetical protein
MATNNATNTSNPITVAQGGSGRATLTDHGVLVGAGTSAITQLAAATDGQLIIGSSGADPVVASLTAGSGITITPGAGSISIAASGSTPNPTRFMAYVTTTLTDVTGANTYVIPHMQATYFDTASAYDSGTGLYTVNATGVWMFGGTFCLSGILAANTFLLSAFGNPTGIGEVQVIQANPAIMFGTTNAYNFQWSTLVPMTNGDTAYPALTVGGNGTDNVDLLGSSGGGFTSFWGYQVA